MIATMLNWTVVNIAVGVMFWTFVGAILFIGLEYIFEGFYE